MSSRDSRTHKTPWVRLPHFDCTPVRRPQGKWSDLSHRTIPCSAPQQVDHLWELLQPARCRLAPTKGVPTRDYRSKFNLQHDSSEVYAALHYLESYISPKSVCLLETLGESQQCAAPGQDGLRGVSAAEPRRPATALGTTSAPLLSSAGQLQESVTAPLDRQADKQGDLQQALDGTGPDQVVTPLVRDKELMSSRESDVTLFNVDLPAGKPHSRLVVCKGECQFEGDKPGRFSGGATSLSRDVYCAQLEESPDQTRSKVSYA